MHRVLPLVTFRDNFFDAQSLATLQQGQNYLLGLFPPELVHDVLGLFTAAKMLCVPLVSSLVTTGSTRCLGFKRVAILLLLHILVHHFPSLLDSLNLASDNAVNTIDWVALSVEELVAASQIRLLRLRIVEVPVNVLELALSHSPEELELDDLVDLGVHLQPFLLQKHTSKIAFGQHGHDKFL